MVFNPLPAPGNGDLLETPLSRLTPNVAENRLDFSAGDPTETCMRNFAWLRTTPKKAILNSTELLPVHGENHRSSGGHGDTLP